MARVKLETYGAREVREAVANLGVGSRVAVSIPDAEVEDVSRNILQIVHELPSRSAEAQRKPCKRWSAQPREPLTVPS